MPWRPMTAGFTNSLTQLSPTDVRGILGFRADGNAFFYQGRVNDSVTAILPVTDPVKGVFGGPATFNTHRTNYSGTINGSYATNQVTETLPDAGLTASGAIQPDASVASNGGTAQRGSGDPFETATGEMTFDPPTDLALPGPFPLVFARHYGSFQNMNGVGTALGTNWMHSFEARLYLRKGFASVLLFPGTGLWFLQNGTSWQPYKAANYPAQLINVAGGYRFLDPSTNIIYGFDANGLLTRMEDRNGNGVNVTQGPSGPTQISDGLGRSFTLAYTNGKLTSVKDSAGRLIQFAYNGDNLISSADADGKITTYSYTNVFPLTGLMTSVVNALGNKVLSVFYDASYRVSRQVNSLNHAVDVTYAGSTTTVKDASLTTTYTYQNLTDIAKISDSSNVSTAYTRDSLGRITSITDRLGNKTTFTYDAVSGYLASQTDGAGNVTTRAYSSQTQGGFTYYVVSKETQPNGSTISFTYDSSGNVQTATRGTDQVTKYTYNARGQALTITSPSGAITRNTYGDDGALSSTQVPSGDVAAFTYDAAYRVTRVKHSDGSTESFAFDNRGNWTSWVDELGKQHAATYSDINQLLSARDAYGKPTTFTYDSEDNIVKVLNAVGEAISVQYNAAELPQTVSNGAGESLNFGFNPFNQAVSIADAAGKSVSIAFDSNGAVSSITDAAGRITKFTRDSLSRINRVTLPGGATYNFTLDRLGRITAIADPLGNSTTASYDARGGLASLTAPGGIAISFTRGPGGQLASITDPNGNIWSRTYDTLGRINGTSDPLGRSWTYSQDNRNRVAGITSPEGTATIVRDAAGREVQRTYADGSAINVSRDDNGRIISGDNLALAYNDAGGIANSNGLAITRTAAGRIGSIDYGGGKLVSYRYNQRGLLESIADWAGGTVTFTYNDAAQVMTITRSNGTVTSYSYDAYGRRQKIAETSGDATIASIALQFDAAGHIVVASQDFPDAPSPAPGTLPLAYDAAHQVSGWTYDGMGRLLGDALRSYAWDPASRLTSYQGADGQAAMTYDAFRQRVSRTGPDGVTRNYILNYATPLPTVATVQAGGADARYYVYLPDGSLLYSIEAADNSRHFYHFDQSGSTTFLTADSGAVTDTYAATPYGETVTQSGSTENPFTWLGEWGVMQESGTSLFYMRRRFYDAASARFLTPDPLESASPLEFNPYQYAAGNPVSNVDPSGLAIQRILSPRELWPVGTEEIDLSPAGPSSGLGFALERRYRPCNCFELYFIGLLLDALDKPSSSSANWYSRVDVPPRPPADRLWIGGLENISDQGRGRRDGGEPMGLQPYQAFTGFGINGPNQLSPPAGKSFGRIY